MTERPRYYAQDHARDNLLLDPRMVKIEDLRHADLPSLAREGFAPVRHETAFRDFRVPRFGAKSHYWERFAKDLYVGE